jgi:dTDP-4-amino-4,6-dideoxygalactose transaminase
MIANHGQSVQYVHDEVGVNSRLDTIQAAILKAKLPHLDEYIAARNKAADYYDKAFANHPNLKTPYRDSKSNHVFHQYTLQTCEIDRDELRKYLGEHGVPAMIYYPIPLHHQKAYKSDRYNDGDFPVTEALCKCVISLPMHTELDEEQLKFITDKVLSFTKK